MSFVRRLPYTQKVLFSEVNHSAIQNRTAHPKGVDSQDYGDEAEDIEEEHENVVVSCTKTEVGVHKMLEKSLHSLENVRATERDSEKKQKNRDVTGTTNL